MTIPTFSDWLEQLEENSSVVAKKKAPPSKYLGGDEYGDRIRNRQLKPSSPPPSKYLGGEEYGDRIRKAHGLKK